MSDSEGLPARGVVFWPVGTGDSTTLIVDDLLDALAVDDPDPDLVPIPSHRLETGQEQQ